MRSNRNGTAQAFPVGLYATLLAALCWLALPRLLQPVERALLGVATLPLRAAEALGGSPVLAGEQQAAIAAAALPCRQLQQRLVQHLALDLDGRRGQLVPVLELGRNGGGGQPAQLLLLRSYQELDGCLPFVTYGEQLLGFLCRPGVGVAEKDVPTDPARVLLLNHPEANAVAAALQLTADERLRFVVEASGSLDPAPMRTALWDDPYRASRLGAGVFTVRTLALRGALGNEVPAGLLIGDAEAWGYGGDNPLAIGVFVTPSIDFRALSLVTVFGKPLDPGCALAPRRAPAHTMALPGSLDQRFHITMAMAAATDDGAAVVQGELCLGRLRRLWFGQALGTSFASSRQRQVLLLLPDDADREPLALWGEVESERGHTVWLRCRGKVPELQPGWLFTGSNGRLCPYGLLLGRAEPVSGDETLLQVALPALPDEAAVEVMVR